jgi:hypothetical protein
MTLMDAWHADPATWHVAALGPPPGQPGTLVPMTASMMFARRLDRREKQAVEDAALLEKLLTATNGNYSRSSKLLDPRPARLRHVGLRQNASLRQQLGGTLALVDQVIELRAFVRAQPHNVFLDGSLFRGHESPPALAYRHSDSENRVRFNDVSH